MRIWTSLALFMVGVLALGCDPEPAGKAPVKKATVIDPVRPIPKPPVVEDDPPYNDGKPQTGLRVVPLLIGETSIEVELAMTYEQRQIGLMYRRGMAENNGMLFVYPERGERGFWMKNTYIPLSLAYIRDDGTISQIVKMNPSKEREPPSYPSKEAVRYCLEMNQGWFERHGIKEGAKVIGLEQATPR